MLVKVFAVVWMGIVIFRDVALRDRVFDSQPYETAWWSQLQGSEVP
jgi:hypothetical protein